MTPIRNLLGDAVRYGLAAGAVGIAGLASTSAFAQDKPATDKKATNLDRVEVLGSRIKRAVDTEPTAPVTTLTRADIEQTGLTSTFDIINHISASDGSGLSTVTTQTNGSDGTQTVSLRNLGPQRTLVLVDGKRWPTGGGGGTGDAGIVDLSTIPVAVIERIEVLKDGASAIYGSDAISGVINIITRKKYEGAQVAWTYGQTTHGDGEQNSEEVTIGANGERSNAVISLSRSEQKAIFAGNRSQTDASKFGCDQVLADFDPNAVYGPEDPHRLARKCGSAISEWGLFFTPLAGVISLNHSADGTSWAPGTKPSDFHANNALDRYNFAPVNYLQQPATRNNLYASGNFEITDSVSAYARVDYNQRRSSQQLAQVPTLASTSGSNGPQWAFGISGGNLFNPFKTAAGCAATATSCADAFIPLAFFRNVAVGPRHNINNFDTLASTAGLQGSFSFADRNFDWEVYGQYNTHDATKVGLNYINLFHLNQGLGASFVDAAGPHCGTPGAIIQGCVPVNLFNGPGMGLGNRYPIAGGGFYTITQQDVANMVNYMSYTEVATNSSRGINYGGNISGEIAPLPGGMLSFAAGVETRRSSARFNPDALVSSGGSSDNFTTPTSGQTKVDEYYLEVDAPILKNVQFAKELEFDAAVRKSSYSASGLVGTDTSTNNPGSPTTAKFSLRWKPFDDLLLRGTYGQTFRAPSVNDLYSGGSENFPQATDPCNSVNFPSLSQAGKTVCESQNVQGPDPQLGQPGHAPQNSDPTKPGWTGGVVQRNGQIRSLGGGNPLLQPEKGHDLTYGFVWSPSWSVLKGFNLTVDYWKIELNNVLTTLGAQNVLDNCYGDSNRTDPNIQPGDPQYCDKVPRNAGGQPTGVITSQFNLARLKQSGVDIGMNYKYETNGWGTFGVKSDSTYTAQSQSVSNKSQALGADTVGEYVGAPNFRWRSNLTFDWTRGDWDANWTMRYMSAQDENFGCNQGTGLVEGLKSFMCNRPESYSHFSPQGQDPAHPTAGLGYNHIGAVVYHDLQVGWKAPWKAHLSVGARNIFGKEPPLVATSFAQSFDASYDLPGGPFYYFQYRQDF
jgi:iron complex outermembrane receptor protein